MLGPTALPSSDVPTCLSAHLQDATACTMTVATAVRRAGIAAERAATVAAGGRYVDVTPWTCPAVRCAVVEGDLLLYRDDNHVTTAYARWLAPLLQEQLAAAVTGAPDPAAGAPVTPQGPVPGP